MTREEIISRAQTIADVMAKREIKQAFAEIEHSIIERWKSGSTLEAREDAFNELRGLEAFKRTLAGFVDQGREASSATLREQKRRSEI